jgi:hypothetical protein
MGEGERARGRGDGGVVDPVARLDEFVGGGGHDGGQGVVDNVLKDVILRRRRWR